ncbi:MAG: DUF3179 domain-containing protein [Actinobacteria bacterium]|nr:MAG: DUF3179 domain-containing protein [Actinomycetota bacterium]
MSRTSISSARSGVPALDRQAYGRFRLPKRLGRSIGGVDDPPMVGATEAQHMRPDDYVIGLVVGGSARAYPLWIVDYYHVVNDRAGPERFIVASCERCQSGSAFLAQPPGNREREPLFRTVGFVNAVLLLKDLRGGSHWNHHDGAGLDRAAVGRLLPWIPAYHMEWADWADLHPDTLVMAPLEDPDHPDARHGHGREEMFARAGMDPLLTATIVGDFDRRYPENEMVLGIEADGDRWAFPLREVHREGGVVHATVGPGRVVVLAGPRPDGFTMAAFVPESDGAPVTLDRVDEGFVDRETSSLWTIEGRCVGGTSSGRALEPVRWAYLRWHSWVYPYRSTALFRSERPRAVVGRGGAIERGHGFGALLGALAARGHRLEVEGPPVSQRRPRESRESLTIRVDGHRVNLHRFATAGAARDFVAFEGAFSVLPMAPTTPPNRTRRVGRLVIESDPERRFADPIHAVPIPSSAVTWAPILDSSVIVLDVIRSLRLARYDVGDVGFLPPGQLRVGCANGIALRVDADRYLLYLFDGPDQAQRYASSEPRSAAFGPMVIRATPDTMYVDQRNEILYAGDDAIRWPGSMDEPRFRAALERAARGKDASGSPAGERTGRGGGG